MTCRRDEVAAPIYDRAARAHRRSHLEASTPGLGTSDSRVITWAATRTSRRFLICGWRGRRTASRSRSTQARVGAGRCAGGLWRRGPRITRLDGVFWVNYTAVSSAGIATALASQHATSCAFERQGIIFPPPNRDVAIFPERIGGRYLALHRPMPEGIGRPAIWLASSPDLLSWGDHRLVAGRAPGHVGRSQDRRRSGAVPREGRRRRRLAGHLPRRDRVPAHLLPGRAAA